MAAADPHFSVIIVNYNAGDYLQKAVDSLKAQTFGNFEVIIVDNASHDTSFEALDTSGLENVVLCPENENHGFAKANNMAARMARGKWLVLLNPDAEAAPDWLEQLVAAQHRHPARKMFASAQIATEHPNLMDGAGDAYLIFGFPWRGGFEHPVTEMPGEGYCFSPCGASGVFERDLFLEHNGFDERFFCYCEDVDIGYRLQLAGEQCIFIPQAQIKHAGSALSGRLSEFSIYHGTRNRLWTYFKCTPWPLIVLTLPVHTALTLYILVRSPAIKRLGATSRGLWDGIKGIAEMKRTSPWSPQKRQVKLWDLAKSMAWNPWQMSQHKAFVIPQTDT
ncbi:glycosyltransferase family 2 protein [Hyphomonas sp.]|uniref:glycosyltransferase family 2 protein n=1 Tax=Hyphomonas sp. TaxID=87 RepID=UPI003527D4FC